MKRTSHVAVLLSAALFLSAALVPARAQFSQPGATSALDAVTSLGARGPSGPGTSPSQAAKVADCIGAYSAVAMCALGRVLKEYSFVGAEISPLKRTSGPQLGEALTCVKLKDPAGPVYIAVFLEGGKYLDARRAVGIDACQRESYALAPPPPVQPAVAAAEDRKARKTFVVPR